MATSGSNLRTRMSPEDYKLACETTVKCFKEHKVEISDAIKTPFPFLEKLHNHKLITNKMYNETKASCENPSAVPKVVYAVLNNMKETCYLPLLEILFSNFMMKNYPDLNGICEGFKDEIRKKISHQESVGDESAENRNTQLEQGTGKNPYPFLSWFFLDESSSTVTSSGDSAKHRNREKPPKASTSAVKRKPESMNLTKSSTSGNTPSKKVRSSEESSGLNVKEKLPEAGSSAVRSGADQEGSMDLGNKSPLQKPKEKTAGQQPDASVKFQAEILPVTCGEMKGLLIKRKLERGATRKCIRTEDGTWLTPMEFEVRGGCGKQSKWKISLKCGGKTLDDLIKLKFIHPPPITRDIKNKEENSDKCKICQDGGKLFCCENCQSFFHGDCHLPSLDTRRNGWNCTFCTTQNSCQSLQLYMESEVLVKDMDPERKSKCEFLLLMAYHHLEGNIFPNIPRGNYVTKASQYLGQLRKLDEIRKKLIMGKYSKVKDFMDAMGKYFQDHRREKLNLNQEGFMKKFKEVFAIKETN